MDKATATLELRDIHLPVEPSYWPLAMGWWIVIVLVLILVFLLAKKLTKIRQQRQLNHLMQQQLCAVKKDFQQHQNKHQLAIDISTLLNRFVIHVLKDPKASALTGDAWVNYLDSRVEKPVFADFRQQLTHAQYQKNSEYDAIRLLATVKNYFPQALKFRKKTHKLNLGEKHA